MRNQTEDRGFGPEPTEVILTLGQWDGITPPATLMDQAGPDEAPLTVEWQARDNEHFFVLVQRLTRNGLRGRVRHRGDDDSSVSCSPAPLWTCR